MKENMTTAKMNPQYLFSLIQSDDGSWMALGSRKINFFEISAKYDNHWGESWNYPLGLDSWDISPIIRNQEIRADIQGFTMVTGSSPLAALGALLDALREEEQKEEQEKLVREQKRLAQEKKSKKKKDKNKIRDVTKVTESCRPQSYSSSYCDEYHSAWCDC